jgi:hypothetical protein
MLLLSKTIKLKLGPNSFLVSPVRYCTPRLLVLKAGITFIRERFRTVDILAPKTGKTD